MIKQITQTLVFFFLFLSSSLPAVPPAIEPSNAASTPTGAQLCNLPPPSFFTMISAGPTWATLSWNSVPSAMAYHIITTEVATGNVVDDSTVPANTNSLTITNLTHSTEYESRIWSVCANGQDGQSYTATFWRSIILDLIVLGYEVPDSCLMERCTLVEVGTNKGCRYPWTSTAATYFKVRKKNGGPEHHFMLKTPGNVLNVYPEINLNSPFSFHEIDGEFLLIYHSDNPLRPIARISTAYLSQLQEGELFRTLPVGENHPEFEIVQLEICSEPAPGGEERGKMEPAPAAFVVASPNPFTDQLTVQITPLTDASEQVTLRLFDMQGFEVFASQTPGGPQKHMIPTANLSPGVYFLRVETAAQIQTIKVVKAQ